MLYPARTAGPPAGPSTGFAVQLDDPVHLYLPECAGTPVWLGGDAALDDVGPQRDPMTVRHLMTHTSGLTYGFMQTNVVDEAYRKARIEFPGRGGTLAQLVQRVAELPLICQPGTQWNADDTSVATVGVFGFSWTDETTPEAGQGQYYLMTGVNGCGEGP